MWIISKITPNAAMHDGIVRLNYVLDDIVSLHISFHMVYKTDTDTNIFEFNKVNNVETENETENISNNVKNIKTDE